MESTNWGTRSPSTKEHTADGKWWQKAVLTAGTLAMTPFFMGTPIMRAHTTNDLRDTSPFAIPLMILGMLPNMISEFDRWIGVGQVGPLPSWPADYGAKQNIGTSSFPEALDLMRQDIREGKPVIALVIFEAVAWHYVTIVSLSDNLKQGLLMDTDGSLLAFTYEELETLMSTSGKDLTLRLITSVASLVSKNVSTFNILRF